MAVVTMLLRMINFVDYSHDKLIHITYIMYTHAYDQ